MKTHTISLLVENHSGALSCIAGLFSSRGYNISSLNVAETEDPSTSRMTIVVSGDEHVLEQVVKQLNRLIDVIKVMDFKENQFTDRELALVRISVNHTNRNEVATLISLFKGQISDVTSTSILAELTGTCSAINNFISLIRPFGIKDVVRTGKIAISLTNK